MKTCMPGFLGLLLFTLSTHANAELLAYDTFEYAVERNKPGASEAFAAHGPWNGAKTYQDGRTGTRGYVYTTDTIPGCTASFPGRNSKLRPGTQLLVFGQGACRYQWKESLGARGSGRLRGMDAGRRPALEKDHRMAGWQDQELHMALASASGRRQQNVPHADHCRRGLLDIQG